MMLCSRQKAGASEGVSASLAGFLHSSCSARFVLRVCRTKKKSAALCLQSNSCCACMPELESKSCNCMQTAIQLSVRIEMMMRVLCVVAEKERDREYKCVREKSGYRAERREKARREMSRRKRAIASGLCLLLVQFLDERIRVVGRVELHDFLWIARIDGCDVLLQAGMLHIVALPARAGLQLLDARQSPTLHE